MNKLRLLTIAASVGVVATMLPGHAASAPAAPKPQITDPAGDANLAAETEISPTLDPVMDEATGTATYKVGA